MAEPLQYLLKTLMAVALEKSLLAIHKFLRLFVNTLTVNDKDYLLERDNLAQPIQMQIFQKQKTFSQLFLTF